eukprot:31244-Pelagococcus_subviridis.AAC.7
MNESGRSSGDKNFRKNFRSVFTTDTDADAAMSMIACCPPGATRYGAQCSLMSASSLFVNVDITKSPFSHFPGLRSDFTPY